MKKVVLAVVALFAFGFANAQEEVKSFGFSKGNFLIEGNLGVSSKKDNANFQGAQVNETKLNSLNFNPKAGYFVTDKIALGVELGIGSNKSENTVYGPPYVFTETKSNSFGGGVFARYYFLELGQRFKTYTEAGLGFGSTKNNVNGLEVSKVNSVNLGIDLGINYFVTNRLAINFGLANVLGYSSSKTKSPNGAEQKSNEFNGNLNVFNNFFDTAQFGLTYKL